MHDMMDDQFVPVIHVRVGFGAPFSSTGHICRNMSVG